MTGASKILTVSYGTFSCTLEGFDEPFSTMKMIAEYFRDLAADDRYFGAEPPTPDAEMLHRIAEKTMHRRVEARIGTNSVVLRPEAEAAEPAGQAEAPQAAPVAAQEAPAAPIAEATHQPGPAVEAPAGQPAPEPAAHRFADGLSVAERLARLRAERAADLEDTAPAEQASPRFEPFEVFDISAGAATHEARGDHEVEPVIAAPAPVESPEVSESPEAPAPVEAGAPEADAEAEHPLDEPADEDSPDAATADTAAEDSAVVEQISEAAAAAEVPTAEEQDATLAAVTAALAAAPDLPVAPETMADEAPSTEEQETTLADVTAALAATPDLPVAPEAMADEVPAVADEMPEAEDWQADPPADQPAPVDRVMVRRLRRMERRRAAMEAAEQAALADRMEAAELAEELTELEASTSAEPELDEAVEVVAETHEVALPAVETAAPEAPAAPQSAESIRLTEAEEADLRAELAELRREFAAEFEDDGSAAPIFEVQPVAEAAVTDAPADPIADTIAAALAEPAAPAAPPAPAARAAMPEVAPQRDVSRLMDAADSRLGDDEQRRKLATITHLRGALAATIAERKVTSRDLPSANDTQATAESFRDDLSAVVTPRRPVLDRPDAAKERPAYAPRLAPLVLVSAQRVGQPESTGAALPPVRPRRVIAQDETSEATAFEAAEPDLDFCSFADQIGAASLEQKLEAAAAYLAAVEGKAAFTRPQLLAKVAAATRDLPREDGMRSFGQLLRQGKLRRAEDGKFALSEDSAYLQRARRRAS